MCNLGKKKKTKKHNSFVFVAFLFFKKRKRKYRKLMKYNSVMTLINSEVIILK